MNKIKESELNTLLENGDLCDYCPNVRGEYLKGFMIYVKDAIENRQRIIMYLKTI